MSRGGERWRCSHHWEHPQTLKGVRASTLKGCCARLFQGPQDRSRFIHWYTVKTSSCDDASLVRKWKPDVATEIPASARWEHLQ